MYSLTDVVIVTTLNIGIIGTYSGELSGITLNSDIH